MKRRRPSITHAHQLAMLGAFTEARRFALEQWRECWRLGMNGRDQAVDDLVTFWANRISALNEAECAIDALVERALEGTPKPRPEKVSPARPPQ